MLYYGQYVSQIKVVNKKQISSSVLAQNWNAQSIFGLELLALELAKQIWI